MAEEALASDSRNVNIRRNKIVNPPIETSSYGQNGGALLHCYNVTPHTLEVHW